MKRNNFFQLLLTLGLFAMFVVDDDGAGGGDVGDFDIDINDNTITPGHTNDVQKPDIKEDVKSDNTEALNNRIAQLEEDARIQQIERDTQSAIARLSNEHEGFDSEKVKEYLIKLNETDPQRAESLNNPIGWDNIWMKEFAPAMVQNDNPNFGRNEPPVDRSEEVREKLSRGETISINDKKALLSKFF